MTGEIVMCRCRETVGGCGSTMLDGLQPLMGADLGDPTLLDFGISPVLHERLPDVCRL